MPSVEELSIGRIRSQDSLKCPHAQQNLCPAQMASQQWLLVAANGEQKREGQWTCFDELRLDLKVLREILS